MSENIAEAIERETTMPVISRFTAVLANDVLEGKPDAVKRALSLDVTLTCRAYQSIFALFDQPVAANTISELAASLPLEDFRAVCATCARTPVREREVLGRKELRDDLWMHCLKTAIAASEVACYINEDLDPDLVYLAGMLHDVGKIVLPATAEKEEIPHGDEGASELQESSLEMETRLMGCSHDVVGVKLLENWGITNHLIDIVRYHHHPGEAPPTLREYALCLHIGDIFSLMTGTGTALDNLAYPVDPLVGTYIKSTAEWELKTFPKLLLRIDNRFQEALTSVGGSYV